jgi:cardiolipin synthase
MTPFVAGNEITLLCTGDEYFPELLRAIDGAQTEVWLETYIFADDPTGRRVAQALADAARRGIAVRVLVDGFGADNLVPALRATLEPAGVEIQVFRPERSRYRLQRHRLRRLHRKLVVVDGRVGFCGGINVQDDRDGLADVNPRFDYAMRVVGPIVEDMHRAMTQLWLLVRWTSLRRDRPARALSSMQPVTPDRGGCRARFVVRDNLRHRRAIEDAYIDAIAGARTEIIIANAYFLPGRRFRRALREARVRGVRVRLLLQGRREYGFVHAAMRALYGSFLEAGIEINDYLAAFLHAKVAVVDGEWATVGSSNIDPFSLFFSREANVVVSDRALAGQLRASLDAAIERGSVVIAAHEWAARPWYRKLVAWIAFQAGRVFVGMTGFARKDDL